MSKQFHAIAFTMFAVLVVSALLVGIYVPAGTAGLSDTSRYWISFVAAVLLVVFYLYSKSSTARYVPTFACAIVTLVGALLVMANDAQLGPVGADIITVGRRTFWALLWILLVTAPTPFQTNVMRTFGCLFPAAFMLTRIPTNVLRAIGPAQHLTSSDIYLVSALLSVPLIACSLALAYLEAMVAHSQSRINANLQLDAGANLRDQALCGIAARYGLTERERITFGYLAMGHTVKRIADELCVSENTVRAHTKAIYRKTGFHSKQEVIDLMSSEVARGSSQTPAPQP